MALYDATEYEVNVYMCGGGGIGGNHTCGPQ